MRISAKLHTEDERLHADFHATVQIGGGSYPVIRYGEGEALQGYVLQSEEGAG